MKKMLSFVTLVCILNLFLAGGFLAYLYATGRLDGNKSRAILDLVRHKGTPPQLRDHLAEMFEPPPATSQAASQTASASAPAVEHSAQALTASAEDRIAFARRAMEQEQLALDREAQDQRHRHELLEKLQAQVSTDLKKIDDAKKESEPRAATTEEKIRDENFSKSLALYDELKSKQVKDIFIDDKDIDLAAAYLSAMEPSRAGKIIGEFKTPEERAFLASVLQRIRDRGTNSASTQPSTQTAAATPSIGAPAPAP